MNTASHPVATRSGAISAASRSASAAADCAGSALPCQFLTFMLGEEQYATGILQIKEIIEYCHMAPVPMMPDCVRGVINLRGAVVPVMDLSARFGRGCSSIGKRSCIVIVEVEQEAREGEDGANGNGAKQVLGMLVDAVNAVVDIAAADIEPPPAFGTRIRPDFISGIGKANGKFVILLAIERVLSSCEIVDLARGANLVRA